jgi:hydrogenase maturation protein HypF
MNERAKIIVHGAVQGVGFRPFIFRLATELNLRGSVLNSSQGVFIEIEGARDLLDQFLLRLEKEKPPRAMIQSLEFSFLDAVSHENFEILPSENSGAKTALILPDIATCADCLRDIFDPQNRRHLYPFTNCTNCGPRFSIIESLPYDRANTSMKTFAMCPDCEREYHDPRDRRFHAQPNACPNCGPRLELWDSAGNALGSSSDALLQAASAVRNGEILALKGIGGFQLLVDARNEKAIQRLRERKHREEKPFALMFPSLDGAKDVCIVNEFEERLLLSPEAPIVLLEKKLAIKNQKFEIANSVAPKNPFLGAMLPYSPLHHILMRELHFPVVATSGNYSGEPIGIDETEALQKLNGVADLFLVHNRPIVRQMDDSVARIIFGREQILRRARGYAPLPIQLKSKVQSSKSKVVLAVGAHLKNSIALVIGEQIFLSQHIGDLETEPAYAVFRKVAADFKNLYEKKPEILACDLHPEYLSTKFAQKQNAEIFSVQHHHAHILSCAAENEIEAPLLGVAWDGTGLGTDGAIWGGEFLWLNETSFERVAHFREFCLPGGEAAIRQPRRAALGLLWEISGDNLFSRDDLPLRQNFSDAELSMIHKMLAQKINSPPTSSVGRLFDAVASIVGLRQRVNFEGQAAMELEFAIQPGVNGSYAFELSRSDSIIIDWQPMTLEILDDLKSQIAMGVIAAKFHNMLAEIIVEVAKKIDEEKVALCGGCFQNKYLLERAILKLQAAGFKPYWHQRVPTNDGGLALGQAVAAIQQSGKMGKINFDGVALPEIPAGDLVETV